MKHLYHNLLLLGAAIGGACPARAQSASHDGLDVSGSIRVRYEALGGQSRAGLVTAHDLVSIRTAILAEYRRSGLRIGGEIYDSRAYGGDRRAAIGTGEVNALEAVQAYVGYEAEQPFGRGSRLGVQLGRFMLNLGSRRLVAADDYRNTTNGYTGLRIDMRSSGGMAATLIYTLPQMRRPDDPNAILANKVALDRESPDLRLWGGVVSRPRVFGAALIEAGYFGLAERDAPARPTRNRHLHSVSARIIREPARATADFELEGIYQFGRVRDSVARGARGLDVSAWFVHADAGYTFPGHLKARLSIEYDRASGDRPGGSFGRFDTIFGMRRADLAPAGIYAQIGRANISTPAIRLEVAPTRRMDGFVAYRGMWLADRRDAFSSTGVRDPAGRSGSFAGSQLEGRIRWWAIREVVRLEANAAWIAKGSFLERAPNAPRSGDTRYLSIASTVTF